MAGLADAQSAVISNASVSDALIGSNCGVNVTYTLTNAVDNHVYLQVFDSNGLIVDTIDTGLQASGARTITWGGSYYNGSRAPSGNYSLRVSVYDAGSMPDQLVNCWSAGDFNLSDVYGIAVAPNGILYVNDGGSRIGMIYPNGTLGLPMGVFSSLGYMAVDSSGDLIATDMGTNTVNRIYPNGTIKQLGNGHNFNWPRGVAIDSQGNIYVTEMGDDFGVAPSTVDEIYTNGTLKILASGNALAGDEGVAVGPNGNIYVSAANGIAVVYPGGSVREFSPIVANDAASDPAGNMYITDANNSSLDMLDSNGALAMQTANPNVNDGTQLGVTTDSVGDVYTTDGPHVYEFARPNVTSGLLNISYTNNIVRPTPACLSANVTSGTTPLTVQFTDVGSGSSGTVFPLSPLWCWNLFPFPVVNSSLTASDHAVSPGTGYFVFANLTAPIALFYDNMNGKVMPPVKWSFTIDDNQSETVNNTLYNELINCSEPYTDGATDIPPGGSIPLEYFLYYYGAYPVTELSYNNTTYDWYSIVYQYDDDDTPSVTPNGSIYHAGTWTHVTNVNVTTTPLMNASTLDMAPSILYALNAGVSKPGLLPNKTKQVVILYIDAFGYNWYQDFLNVSKDNFTAINDSPNQSIISNISTLGTPIQAMAVYPSFTNPNSKALLTGVGPDLFKGDFASTEPDNETIFDTLNAHGMTAAWIDTSYLVVDVNNSFTCGTPNAEVNEALQQYDDGTNLVVIHFDQFDKEVDGYGPNSTEAEGAVKQVDAEVGHILSHINNGTEVIVWADHGCHPTKDGGNHYTLVPDDMYIPIIVYTKT